MKLTKRTDFVLRTLIYLAKQPEGTRTFLQEIADNYDIPVNHLTKIVHQLGQLGYINTYRGRGGGMEIGKPLDQIMVKDVILHFEPNTELVDCSTCLLRKRSCKLEHHLHIAYEAFLSSLDGVSLADII